jgi:hypothetical protein
MWMPASFTGPRRAVITRARDRILRANLDIPRGQTPTNRADIELLYNKLPEPIDLDLDLESRLLYWTDRGDPPRGNTVNRAPLEAARGGRPPPEIVFSEGADEFFNHASP